MLTPRENEVLSCFVQTNDYLKLVDVAKMLNISTRTVTRSIKTINETLANSPNEIKFVHGLGYCWVGSDSLFQELQQSSDDIILVRNLLVKFVRHDDITIDCLSDELNYSDSTILKKIPEVKDILKDYHLKLKSTPTKGYKIIGSEVNKRELLSEYAFAYFNNQVTKIVLNELSPAEFSVLRNQTVKFLVRHQMILSDYDTSRLVVYLALSIARTRAGYELSEFNVGYSKEINYPDCMIELFDEVLPMFNVTFNQNEFNYVIQSSDFIAYSYNQTTTVPNKVKLFIQLAIDKITKESIRDYEKGKEFLDALAIHINLLVQRSRGAAAAIKNPLLQEVKKSHPIEMYDAIKLGKLIESEFDIELNEDEISYLAIHLGANNKEDTPSKTVAILCSYGVGTSQLIKGRLESDFPTLTVVGIYPIQYLEVAQAQQADFLISTVPLPDYQGQSQLIVTENILGDEFYKNISQDIINNNHQNEDYLTKLLAQANFTKYQAKDKESALDYLFDLADLKGSMPGEVMDDIREREQVSSTDIGNLVAIPHTLSSGEFNSQISIGILEEPILWGNERVQLIFMIVMNQKDAVEAGIFKQLYGYFKSMSKVNKLIEASTLEEFIQKIK